MTTIDRLKTLYKERYMEHFDIDIWHDAIDKEWPKLLAVVEAADILADLVTSASEHWPNLKQALRNYHKAKDEVPG
jgi:hypothetical protein